MKMDNDDFQYKGVSKDNFDRTHKQITRGGQERPDIQSWNNDMKSIKDTHLIKHHSVQNDTKIKQSGHIINRSTSNYSSTHDSANVLSLYDPSDLHHLDGLRNRLCLVFNEFSKVIKNELLPPILKSTKKMNIKIKEYEQQANNNYIFDLNLLFSEVKKESENEKIYKKKNKTNLELKRTFQIKLIKCYKLAIDTIQICSKTLEASIYNPIQSKMINIIHVISSLSLITEKYIHGDLYKKKKKESFDLVQHCKAIESMLDSCGYKDTEHEDSSNNHSNIPLNELSKKALAKIKSQMVSTDSNRLNMYSQPKPKLGSKFAQNWTENKSFISTNNKEIEDELICTNMENISFDFTDEETFQTPSEMLKITKLKTDHNNVGFFTVEDNRRLGIENDKEIQRKIENVWNDFQVKNAKVSPNESRPISISLEEEEKHCLSKNQFNELKKPVHETYLTSNLTESTIDDLPKEELLKATDYVIKAIIMSELCQSSENK